MAAINSLLNSFFVILAVIIFYQAIAGSGSVSVVEANKSNEKLVNLTFFWHDVVRGPAPTVVQVITPTNTTSLFGGMIVIDDPLTETREPDSTPLGRAQGMYAGASQTEPSFLMLMNFYLTSGEYKGSTISIMGRNAVLDTVREMSIVGGTGKLRYARGYAQAQTVSFNSTGDAIVKYDVFMTLSTPV